MTQEEKDKTIPHEEDMQQFNNYQTLENHTDEPNIEDNNQEDNFDDFDEYNQDNGEEAEEIIVDEDNDEEINFYFQNSQTTDYHPSQKIVEVVNTYNAYFYNSPAYLVGNIINLQLPRDFLPLSLQDVYGFLDSDILLNIQIDLFNFSWSTKPNFISIEHPIKKDKYVGNPLVKDLIQYFFSEDYQPRNYYRSKHYLLKESGEADTEKVTQLVSDGFDQDRAINALILCQNKLSDALQFLKTGNLPSNEELDNQITEFRNCPLLYFVLEVAECFFDLQDHCCICRTPIQPGLKPTVCDGSMCLFQFTQIGLGLNVVEEIQRDPMAADLIFSIFACAIGSTYFNPRPPGFGDSELKAIANSLPSMSSLTTCKDDSELAARTSSRSLELLRWVLFSNRSQMITLENSLRLPLFNNSNQFLTLISTPQAERKFRKLKDIYGSQFLFHGSAGKNWHSIIRNGLKNASDTDMMAHGKAYGSGIYFAHDSSVSFTYSTPDHNLYSKSALGNNLTIIALCEIAKVDTLQNHGWAYTLENEAACIVRFLLVNGSYQIDVDRTPITKTPKLKDVLNYKAESKSHHTISRSKD